MPASEREHLPPTELRLHAYAKINLSLEIVGKRPDGFHEIISLTQMVSIADTVVARAGPAFQVQMEPPLVDAANDISMRAARLLSEETGHPLSGSLSIQKQIPLAAGLGGGSSDAAAVLRLLDRLWSTRLGPRRLAPLAAAIGSDVPLFLGNGRNLIRGRGEIVMPQPPGRPFWAVLIYPGGAPADKTRALYGALAPEEFTSGSATLALTDWLLAGRCVTQATLSNAFDAAGNRVYPGFSGLRAELEDAIGKPVHLSGAGPTVFAVFASLHDAHEAAGHVARRVGWPGLQTFIVRSVSRRPRIRSHGAPHETFSRSSDR